ncbi:MAG: hypothetical protein JKY09_01145 [Crocinitomicaceae bacterium]|nr:hypothetical protein [Crocinitomicaceae bacterium]
MKHLFAIILCLSFNSAWGQTKTVEIYHWDDLLSSVDPDTVYGVSFAKMKLDSLPEALSTYKNVVHLDLSKNRLSKLPDFITDFGQLEVLNLEKNRFDHLPIQLCRMTSVKRLILNRNQLESLPNCIQYMAALQYIDLYDNPIRSLPEDLVNLNNLEGVDLSGIRFSPRFQASWNQKLPNVKWVFDAPCDCMK